jgi:hypothetical protein
VDGAALPGRAEHLADRVLQSFVRVGDDQRHAGQATLDHASEEVAPERLGLALAAVEADHLAPRAYNSDGTVNIGWTTHRRDSET